MIPITWLLQWQLQNYSFADVNNPVIVSQSKDQITFEYPCTNTSNCTSYELFFQPGVYQIELYGASGGGNVTSLLAKILNLYCDNTNKDYFSDVSCEKDYSRSGAGGYISGKINFTKPTKAFLTIGGKGTLSQNSPNSIGLGGFNGGGSSMSSYDNFSAASGGGATDLRIEINDLYHRILVAGAGGGSDDQGNEADGFGGAGGNSNAQGPYYELIDSISYFDPLKIASQNKGYSFGFGENGHSDSDGGEAAGAGGGWYGGYCFHHHNSGAGGGSSFALGELQNQDLPEKYSFTQKDYLWSDVIHRQGIRGGNGKAIIKIISPISPSTPRIKNLQNAKQSDRIFYH